MKKPWNSRARTARSARKGDAILDVLKGKSGDIDILQKHLSLEQAINADDPLLLDNKLVLLQDGPATYKAMFAAMRAARTTSTWKPTYSRTMRLAGSSPVCCWKNRPPVSRST